MNTEQFKKLIRALAEEDLTMRDAYRMIQASYEKVPELEKELTTELKMPVDRRRAIISSESRNEQAFTLMGYDMYNQLVFIERQDDRVKSPFHLCDAVGIERFISREYNFAKLTA